MATIQKQRVIGARTPRPIYSGVRGKLAQAWDSIVGLFSPGTAHGMQAARMRSAASLAFEAATVDRMMPREQTASADAEVLPNLATMRARSRRQTQDDSHAESAADLWVDGVVGAGIRPQCAVSSSSSGSDDAVVQKWRKDCEAYFNKWSTSMADASGHGDFYDLQALVARTRRVDGECFTHTVVGGDNMLTIEVIDSDRVDNPIGKRDTNNLRAGVVTDSKGKPEGYWIAKQHPDDVELTGKPEFVLIPRMEGELSVVQHHFRRKRVAQTRGYPDSAPSANYLEHLHHYLKSEIIGARAAANYSMFIKKSASPDDQGMNPVLESNGGSTETVYHEAIEAGTIAYLNEDEEPFAFNPNRPGAGDDFVKRMLNAVGGAAGMSRETLTRDYGGMNYSSMRGLLKQEQRGYDRDRGLMNRQFNTPVWRNVIRHGIQTGALTPPKSYLSDPNIWLAVEWIPPAIGWVDPVKEIGAAKDAIEANLSTPWHEAGRSGLDPIEVLERNAYFIARRAEIEAEYGIPPGSLAPGASGPSGQQQGSQPDENPESESEEPEAPSSSGEDESENDDDTSSKDEAVQATDDGKDIKAKLDAIGVAMRSGMISPSQADEESTRALLGLPPMTPEILEAWEAEPVRRPVTLSPVKDAATEQAADAAEEDSNPEGDSDEGSEDGDQDPVPTGSESEEDE